MPKEIEHGVQIGITPEIQTDSYIEAKLLEEKEVTEALIPDHEHIQETLASVLSEALQDNSRLIEVGTGTGYTTLKVLKELPDSRILAVDTSKKRLDRARYRLKGKDERIVFANKDFTEMSAEKEEELVDGIFTAFALHNLPLVQRIDVLRKAYSLLRPGGIFVDADKHGFSDNDKNNLMFNQQLDRIRQNFPNGELAQLWTDHYKKDFEIDQSREDYTNLLGEIGFSTEVVLESGLEVVIKATK